MDRCPTCGDENPSVVTNGKFCLKCCRSILQKMLDEHKANNFDEDYQAAEKFSKVLDKVGGREMTPQEVDEFEAFLNSLQKTD